MEVEWLHAQVMLPLYFPTAALSSLIPFSLVGYVMCDK